MTSVPLRHFVEEAFGRYGPQFGGHFPAGFDWLALCASAPHLAERIDVDAVDSSDETQAAPVRKRAFLYFQFGYIVALSALALRAPYPWAPEDALELLMGPLSGEQESAFVALCESVLGPVEHALATDDDGSAELVEGLVDLAEVAWSATLDLMAETIPDASDAPAVRAVCVGLARTSSVLAAFRWVVGAPTAK